MPPFLVFLCCSFSVHCSSTVTFVRFRVNVTVCGVSDSFSFLTCVIMQNGLWELHPEKKFLHFQPPFVLLCVAICLFLGWESLSIDLALVEPFSSHFVCLFKVFNGFLADHCVANCCTCMLWILGHSFLKVIFRVAWSWPSHALTAQFGFSALSVPCHWSALKHQAMSCKTMSHQMLMQCSSAHMLKNAVRKHAWNAHITWLWVAPATPETCFLMCASIEPNSSSVMPVSSATEHLNTSLCSSLQMPLAVPSQEISEHWNSGFRCFASSASQTWLQVEFQAFGWWDESMDVCHAHHCSAAATPFQRRVDGCDIETCSGQTQEWLTHPSCLGFKAKWCVPCIDFLHVLCTTCAWTHNPKRPHRVTASKHHDGHDATLICHACHIQICHHLVRSGSWTLLHWSSCLARHLVWHVSKCLQASTCLWVVSWQVPQHGIELQQQLCVIICLNLSHEAALQLMTPLVSQTKWNALHCLGLMGQPQHCHNLVASCTTSLHDLQDFCCHVCSPSLHCNDSCKMCFSFFLVFQHCTQWWQFQMHSVCMVQKPSCAEHAQVKGELARWGLEVEGGSVQTQKLLRQANGQEMACRFHSTGTVFRIGCAFGWWHHWQLKMHCHQKNCLNFEDFEWCELGKCHNWCWCKDPKHELQQQWHFKCHSQWLHHHDLHQHHNLKLLGIGPLECLLCRLLVHGQPTHKCQSGLDQCTISRCNHFIGGWLAPIPWWSSSSCGIPWICACIQHSHCHFQQLGQLVCLCTDEHLHWQASQNFS